MFSLLTERPATLLPEILDELPPDHPDARRSRRDLVWFNAALGNFRWFERRLPSLFQGGERVLEIGAGTGELGLRMAARGLAWDGLDRAPRPPGWPSSARWHQQDVFQFAGWSEYPVVAANLFLHHFDAGQLRALGALISVHTRVLIVGDLLRGRVQQGLFWTFAQLVGANRVSFHDGRVSIRAGFRANELPVLLGLDRTQWTWSIEPYHWSAYRLVALRRP